MDKIIITDLEAYGVIGVKHPERDHPQLLIVNLALCMDLKSVGNSDNIGDTINYSTVTKFIISEISLSKFHTVEALCGHLTKRLFEVFPADEVQIRIEKPKKVENTARVGVEIQRNRSDYK